MSEQGLYTVVTGIKLVGPDDRIVFCVYSWDDTSGTFILDPTVRFLVLIAEAKLLTEAREALKQ